MSEFDHINKIIILGGGTASGLIANFLSFYGKNIHRNFEITVIDNPATNPIGVGEATSDILTIFMEEFCYFTPQEFMKNTDAVFKHGIQFKNWSSKKDSYYWNPLYERYGSLKDDKPGLKLLQSLIRDFDNFSETYLSTYLMEKSLSPFDNKDKKIATYAMHFDSLKASKFFRNEASKVDVNYIDAKVEELLFTGDNPTGVRLDGGVEIHADFLIDCMGFASLFKNTDLSGEFEDCSDKILCNKAIVSNYKYKDKEKELFCYTRADAQSAGWIWTIPMWSKVSSAYVYSSDFISDDDAKRELINYHKDKELYNFRSIPFKTGYYSRPFRQTSMSLGLSSNFFEPLESTSIILQIFFINTLKDIIDGKLSFAEANLKHNNYYEEIVDFLFLHYFLSDRDDSEFWKRVTSDEMLYSRSKKTFDKFKSFLSDDKLAVKAIRESAINPNLYFSIFDGLDHYKNEKIPTGDLHDYYNMDEKSIKNLPSAFKQLKKIHNEI